MTTITTKIDQPGTGFAVDPAEEAAIAFLAPLQRTDARRLPPRPSQPVPTGGRSWPGRPRSRTSPEISGSPTTPWWSGSPTTALGSTPSRRRLDPVPSMRGTPFDGRVPGLRHRLVARDRSDRLGPHGHLRPHGLMAYRGPTRPVWRLRLTSGSTTTVTPSTWPSTARRSHPTISRPRPRAGPDKSRNVPNSSGNSRRPS